MSMVAPIEPDQVPLLIYPYFAEGDPGPIVATLAHVPELLVVAAPFLGVVLSPSAITLRAKEIVIVRTSVLAGCRYCMQTHTVVALDAGLNSREVAALRNPAPTGEVFDSPRERALLTWIDLVAPGNPIDDAARQSMRSQWADHEIVELTLLVGATLMLNRFATALDLPTSAGTIDRLAREGLL